MDSKKAGDSGKMESERPDDARKKGMSPWLPLVIGLITIIAILLIIMLLVFPMAGKGTQNLATPTAPAERKCPDSCDDANPCTRDNCESSTGYGCVNTPLDGVSVEGCEGRTERCAMKICKSGVCGTDTIANCCGNGVCEEDETADNCPGDCGGVTTPPGGAAPQAGAKETNCANGLDDDQDGNTDCCDSDCDCTETLCSDGEDNDCDSYVDCEDADCDCVFCEDVGSIGVGGKCPSNALCYGGESCGAQLIKKAWGDDWVCTCISDGDETGNCDDGLDNDNDGEMDCEDPECSSDEACQAAPLTETQCDNGVDDDKDGETDCADIDCDCCGEFEPGADGKCPQDVFCGTGRCVAKVIHKAWGDDTTCSCEAVKRETGNCDDGIDNDADGRIDCVDGDCSGDDACQLDGEPKTCGEIQNPQSQADCDFGACSMYQQCVYLETQVGRMCRCAQGVLACGDVKNPDQCMGAKCDQQSDTCMANPQPANEVCTCKQLVIL